MAYQFFLIMDNIPGRLRSFLLAHSLIFLSHFHNILKEIGSHYEAETFVVYICHCISNYSVCVCSDIDLCFCCHIENLYIKIITSTCFNQKKSVQLWQGSVLFGFVTWKTPQLGKTTSQPVKFITCSKNVYKQYSSLNK